MSKLYDVVIAGAGPIGLFLACELGLAGTSVLVLERDLELGGLAKTEPLGLRGLNTVAMEALYRRGLLREFFKSRDQSPQKKFGGHFAGMMLDASKLDLDRWRYRLPGPALVPGPTSIERMETTLSERAESLGVTILRGHGVTGIAAQDHDSVTVEAGEGQTFRGRWLVGCDGGRSVIRRAAGFDFVGTEAKFTGYAAKCDWEPVDKLKSGFLTGKTGLYIVQPNVLRFMDFDDVDFDRTQEITQEHLQDVLNRATGSTDVKITNVELATSFTDRSKQVTSYRKGRILLAGDAAHIHSPLGGQGMNLGLGDAMNLGWKLAATIRREAASDGALVDFALLDTYGSERHSIAAQILDWTRAQVTALQPDPFGAAVHTLISNLIDTTDGNNLFIDRVWGLSQRYILGDDDAHSHPLVGCSAPDFELTDGSRLGSKLEGGRGLLVDFGDDATLKDLILGGSYEARVDYLSTGAKDQRGIRAFLVRPDGAVAWVVGEDGEPDVAAAKAALERWFEF